VRAFLLFLTLAGLATCATLQPRGGPRPAPRQGFVAAEGHDLTLDGRPYRFLGVNVYSLASFPPGSGGFVCGIGWTDDGVRELLDDVRGMGGNAVRIDVYQSFTMGGEDFSRVDLILREASARGIRVVMTLENQWEDCTRGGYKYADWYRDGYRRPYGGYPMSYRDYVARVVRRYRDEPAVLMWQLMNEAESRTVHGLDDPEALLGFAADMADVVERNDPDHLLSLGTIGLHRPGSGGAFYALLHQIDGIDLVEAHDYHEDEREMPRDVWNAIVLARAIRKPFFIGEVGISSPPVRRSRRARLIARKLEAAWNEGADGVLIWAYRSFDGTDKDFDRNDPLYGTVRRFARTRGPL
jgi:endo-1,4-beta-mannosidase